MYWEIRGREKRSTPLAKGKRNRNRAYKLTTVSPSH